MVCPQHQIKSEKGTCRSIIRTDLRITLIQKQPIMETARERYKRLIKEECVKYTAYFSALRKAAKDQTNSDLQREVEQKKRYWLEAVQQKRNAW